MNYNRIDVLYLNSSLTSIYKALDGNSRVDGSSVVVNSINYLGVYYNLLRSSNINYTLFIEYNNTLTRIHGDNQLDLAIPSTNIDQLEATSIENIIIHSAIQSISTLLNTSLPSLTTTIPSKVLLHDIIQESSNIFHHYYLNRSLTFPSKLLTNNLIHSTNRRLGSDCIFTNKHAHNHLDLQIKQHRYPDINFLSGFIVDIANELNQPHPLNSLVYNLLKSKYLIHKFK